MSETMCASPYLSNVLYMYITFCNALPCNKVCSKPYSGNYSGNWLITDVRDVAKCSLLLTYM